MNITLKPEEEQLIQEKLRSGKYQTAYEVIVEALRLLAERDKYYQKWVEETRQKVVVGLQQLNQHNSNTITKTPEELGWLPGFFERTAGCFQDEPLVRYPQGELQERDWDDLSAGY